MVAILKQFFFLVDELLGSLDENSVDLELAKEVKKWLEISKGVIK